MLGYVIWHPQGRKHPTLECRTIDGISFLVLETSPIRPFWGKRRLRRVGETLSRSGVRCAAVEGEVPPELLARFGLEEIDCSPLRLACLEQLLAFAAARQEVILRDSCVALRAERIDAQVVRAARILAGCARRVTLDVRAGQEELERLLRWEYGLAPGGSPELQLCVSCSPQLDLPALHIGRGCRHRQKIIWDYPELPQAEESLLAAIFQAKREIMQDIRVKSVEFSA